MKISSLSSYFPSSTDIPKAAKILAGTAAATAAVWISYQSALWMFTPQPQPQGTITAGQGLTILAFMGLALLNEAICEEPSRRKIAELKNEYRVFGVRLENDYRRNSALLNQREQEQRNYQAAQGNRPQIL